MTLFLKTAATSRGLGLFRAPLLRSHRVSLIGVRNLTTNSRDEEKEVERRQPSSTPTLPPFVNASLRGVGQVIFLISPSSGLIVLGGLAIGDPYLAALAAAGTVSATTAASVGGLDKSAIHDGLLGYNGCLVGCAVSVFVSPLPESFGFQYPLCMTTAVTAAAVTCVGAAASPFVAAALKPAMGSVPQWTLAFNFVTLTMLLRTKPLAGALVSTEQSTVFDLSSLPSNQLVSMVWNVPLKGISQIFVLDSALGGATVLGGIALYSPGLAAHALIGSSIGAVSGLLMGANVANEIAIGLWGYNSALTSMAVGTFFCHSRQTVSLSVGGAAATAALFGALKTVFGDCWSSPCLTLPFCITMSGCYLLKDAIPGLVLATNPHSPEKNEPPSSSPSD